MQKVLAVLFAGMAFAGAVQAAEPVRAGAGQAYADVVDKRLAVEGGAVDLKNGYGMYIAVKPSIPLTEKLSAYGKVGVAQTRRPALPTPAPGALGKKTDTGAYGAFGLQYSITPNAAVTLEYERLPMKKPDVLKPNVWTLALQFFF